MNTLCLACRGRAAELRKAIKAAERARRRGEVPDLDRIEQIKERLETELCGCWARSKALPPVGARQPEPVPSVAPAQRPVLPSPRLRLKPSGRPLRTLPSRDVIAAATSGALAPERLRSPSAACPVCGVTPPGRPRNDGGVRKHRVELDNPAAPYCSGGAA